MWLSIAAAFAQDPACVPPCREGFLCHQGACISACNPECPPGERCTADARCVADAPPPPATGEICAYRRRSAVGAAIRVGIRENDLLITSLSPGRFHCWATAAGPHHLTAKTEVEKAWDVEVIAGQTTYLEAKIVMGALVGRPEIAVSDRAGFEDTEKPWVEANQ
jgi:hypothetical protein